MMDFIQRNYPALFAMYEPIEDEFGNLKALVRR